MKRLGPAFAILVLALAATWIAACETEGQNMPNTPLDTANNTGKDAVTDDKGIVVPPDIDTGPSFNGTLGWKVLNPGVKLTWNTLAGVETDDGNYRIYAGGFGLVATYDGGYWETMDVGESLVVYSVWALSENYLAVCGEEGLLKRYYDWKGNGEADWYDDDAEVANKKDLKAVHGYDENNLWAVGANGTVLQYADGEWKKWTAEEIGLAGEGTPPKYPDFNAVLVLGPLKAMLVGDGLLVTYEAGVFTINDTDFTGYELSIIYPAEGKVWIGADKGTIFEQADGGWEQHHPNVYSQFAALWMSPSGTMHATGPDLTTVVWQYDGNPDDNWGNLPVESPKFIRDQRAKEGLADRIPTQSRISGLWGLADDNIFICTKEKQIIHYAVHP